MQRKPALAPAGIDRLLADERRLAALRRWRVGLLSSEAALTADWRPVVAALAEALGPALVRLFAPEHGWSGAAPAGASVDDETEPSLGLPVVSLYRASTAPPPEAFADLDLLIVDLQDVGVRCYTYAATAALLLDAFAAAGGPEVLVCDRPNPLGLAVDGPALDPQFRSFVGLLDVPFRHGRTIGGLLADRNSRIACAVPLTILPADAAPVRPWVPPSPGLPTRASVLLYPGLVLLEGTTVSEGRGTSLPFATVAAPGLDGERLARWINGLDGTGVAARPLTCRPESGKLAGQVCRGVQVHVLDEAEVDGFTLGVRLLGILAEHCPGFAFTEAAPGSWRRGPGAGEPAFFIDYLAGTDDLRAGILAGTPADELLDGWRAASGGVTPDA